MERSRYLGELSGYYARRHPRVSRLCSRYTELGESVSERSLILRFLANENFPAAAVASPVAAGHDVVWVKIVAPGMPDPEVLAWAARASNLADLSIDEKISWPIALP